MAKLVEKVRRAEKVEAAAQRTLDVKRRRLNISKWSFHRFNYMMTGNGPGQRKSKIYVVI